MLLYIFLATITIAFILLFLGLYFEDMLLGLTAGILFFILSGSVFIQGIDISNGSKPLDYTLNSFDYQSGAQLKTATNYFILMPNINQVLNLNEDLELSTHIYLENLAPINTSATKCILYIYAPQGAEIYHNNMSFEPSYNYENDIDGSLLSEEGKYNYRIYCSGGTTPARYGAIESYFIVKKLKSCTTDERTQAETCSADCPTCNTTYRSNILAIMLLLIGLYIILKGVLQQADKDL